VAAREIFEIIINADGTKATSTFNDLSSKISKNFGDLESKSGGFIDNLVSKSPLAQTALDKVGVSGAQAGSLIEKAIPLAVVAGGAAIGGFAVKAISDFQNLAQETLHFQQVAGGTAEEASRWVQTADDFGVSTETLSGAMGKFEKSIGTSPQKLKDLGVNIAQTNSGAVDLQGTFYNVIDAYNATEDPTQRAAIAQQAFGKQWQSLVKLLDAGSTSIRQNFDSINKGQILKQSDLQASEDFRHAMDDLSDSAQALEVEFARGVVPTLAAVAGGFAKLIKSADDAGTSVQNFGESNRSMLGPLGDFLGTLTGGTVVADNNKKKTEELKTAQDQLHESTSRVTKSSDDWKTSLEATTQPAATAKALVDAYNQTLKDIDAQSKVATQAHQDHAKALDALRDVYGSDTAVMISNMGLSDTAMQTMAGEAKNLLSAMQGSFDGATDVVSHFADQGQVSSNDVIGWMHQQVDEAHTWASGLKELAADGIDHGILQKLEEAGPKSAGLISALLEAVKRGDIDAINAMQADLNTTLSGAQSTAAGYEAGFASTGTALGTSMKDGTTDALSNMGAAVGSAAVTAAQAAQYSSMPSFVDAGSALGQAFIRAAAATISNYHPATTPNLGGGKDIRAQATGGVTTPGALTLVGEKGPELIVPGIQPKTVIPNKVLAGLGGGGMNATININAPVYGVDDLQGAIYGALDDVRRRAMAGAR
jgi:hypothetical protein